MMIPSREEFSPLPEVIDRFGLPDFLEILPELENQLEVVEESNARIAQVAEGLRQAADDLDTEASAVHWQGAAGDAFRAKNAEATKSLRYAADNINTVSEGVVAMKTTAEDVVHLVIKVLTWLAAIAGALLAVIGIAISSVLIGVIAAGLAYWATLGLALLAFWDHAVTLAKLWWELVTGILNKINELIKNLGPDPGDPVPTPQPSPLPEPKII